MNIKNLLKTTTTHAARYKTAKFFTLQHTFLNIGFRNLKFFSTSCVLNTSTKTNTNILDIKPIVIYTDADVEKTKILADNRKKVGIYR